MMVGNHCTSHEWWTEYACMLVDLKSGSMDHRLTMAGWLAGRSWTLEHVLLAHVASSSVCFSFSLGTTVYVRTSRREERRRAGIHSRSISRCCAASVLTSSCQIRLEVASSGGTAGIHSYTKSDTTRSDGLIDASSLLQGSARVYG